MQTTSTGAAIPAQTAALAVDLSALGEPVSDLRVRSDGKHLSRGGLPFRVRGATYGSFQPRSDGELYPEPDTLLRDLAAMANLGLNVVRTYTLPPVELLEMAAQLGLHVLVGLHYDDWRTEAGTGRRAHQRVLDHGLRAVDAALERVAGRDVVLAVSVGNEVPADLVRLHGIRPVEKVLGRLVEELHAADPDLLATYSNFPTTEYLQIPDLDLTCFNVFLEDPDKLRAYLRHLHVVAGETPLLITELGLAAQVHGEPAQAASLDWQLRLVDETGCAGATVFAWTDEWGVAGEAVEGWGFGLTHADRTPKPAADVVRDWADRSVRDIRQTWPSLSVVVCAYNEARLLHECLDSLMGLEYPGLEVILCDDGSSDATLEIMRGYPFRVLDLPHAGLSAARNAGLAAAQGDIVAYLDADAHCHPEWPYHLALSLEDDGVVATGGPNLPVVSAGFVERVVAASPGGPVEVLVGDDRAEHVPGCNMAFRRDDLAAIEGFDVVYTSAGDDVDVCWKLLDRGGEIAFAHAAQVRHHRRSSVRAYLKQQRGYGRSEKMVAARHRHRFNRLGQARWSGVIYGGLRMLPSVLRPVIYHGSLGAAPYQSVTQQRAAHVFGWYAALLPLTAPLAAAGLLLAPLVTAMLALTALAVALVLGYTGVVAAAADPPRGEDRRLRWRVLLTLLHVMQPFVRAWGRLRGPGIGPRSDAATQVQWGGDRLRWILDLGRALSERRLHVEYGDARSTHDLTASIGPFVCSRLTTAVVWGWTPRCRIRMSLRGRAWMLLALGVVSAPLAATASLVAVVAIATICGVEAVLLKVRIAAAVQATTAQARSASTHIPTA